VIVNIARFRAKPGGEKRLEALLRDLTRRALARPNSGTHDFVLCRSKADPGPFLLYERLDSEAHLEAHRATDFVKQFRRDSEPVVQELAAELLDIAA
jgi:quinol monooxygenase YgiN